MKRVINNLGDPYELDKLKELSYEIANASLTEKDVEDYMIISSAAARISSRRRPQIGNNIKKYESKESKQLEIAMVALDRISDGHVCVSYEYDSTATEKELAKMALNCIEKIEKGKRVIKI